MAKQITYKDSNGNIQTVDFLTSYPVKIATTSTDEWELKTHDDVVGIETTEYIGGRPKDRG